MKRLFITLIVLLTFAMAQGQSPVKLKSGAWIGSFNADPSFHIEGWILYNTTTNQVKYSNGTAWIPLGFDTTLDYTLTGVWSFSEAVDFNDDIDLGGNTINGVGNAIDDDQVYNKGQVDTLLENLNTDNIYTSNGTLADNTSRSLTLGASNQLQFVSGGESLTLLNNPSLGSLFALDYEKLQIDNEAVSLQANDTDAFKIYGKRGLQIEMGNASGTKIMPNVGDSFRVANATTGAVEYYTPPSAIVPFVEIDASTYTITQSQIENFTQLYISDNQTDVTLTLPATTLTGQQFISVQHLGTGTITIIPDTGVNLQQYVSTSTQSFVLGSIVQNEWFVKSGSVTASTYTPPSQFPVLVDTYHNAIDGSSLTVATTPSDGNYLIAFVVGDVGNYNLPTTTGWTLLDTSELGSFVEYNVYGKFADGTETDIIFSRTTGGVSRPFFASILEYSGVNTVTPIEDLQTKTSSNLFFSSSDAVTSTNTNSLAISSVMALAINEVDDTITSAMSNYTEVFSESTTIENGYWNLVYSSELPTAATKASEGINFSDRVYARVVTFILNSN